MLKTIDYTYLTPNYDAVAKIINDIHGSNYTNRAIKHIHKGRHARTQDTIKLEIDSIVGPYRQWFDRDGKKQFTPQL